MRSKCNSTPPMQNILNYSKSTFECKILKKKFIGSSARFLYIFKSFIVINKEPLKKKPDHLFQINLTRRVIWKYSDENKQTHKRSLKGFTLDYEDQSFDYLGEESVLLQLKQQFAPLLFQAKVQEEYQAMQVVGQGNYALVLELRHLHSNLKLASKCIDKTKLENIENGMKSVLNEIKIMRTLSPHPGIINLHEVYEGDNNIYLIMDLAQGGSLYNEMKYRQNQFTRKEIQKILFNLLTSLKYMHSKNIIHRDLKPENILFKVKGDLESQKIADFGLSTFVDDVPYLFPKCGTPGFVAPEIVNLQEKNEPYGPECDIFSAGVIFHILLFGEGVFKGKGHNEILKMNKLCEIDFTQEKYFEIDSDAQGLLFKMLEKDPEIRLTAEQCLHHAFFFNEEPPIKNEIHSFKYIADELQSKFQDISPLITRTPLYIRKKEISLKDLQKINEFNNVSVFSLDKIDQKTKKSYDESEDSKQDSNFDKKQFPSIQCNPIRKASTPFEMTFMKSPNQQTAFRKTSTPYEVYK